MATMATGDDEDDGDDDDGATTTDDVGDGGMGAATGYDDDDAFDCCGIFQWRRRWTKARWRGQKEMQQSKNRGNGGSGGNKRSFTDSHLKDLQAVFVQNEMVPRA
jgi:hypothetical protein